MIRAFVFAFVASAALVSWSASASEITAVAEALPEVCKTNCHSTLHECSGGCREEITPSMEFFTVCQTECERNHMYCTAGC
jgi:hypothetical protein